jgi:DNA polymerase
MPTPAGPGEALHWQIGPLQALHPGPDEAPRWLLLSEQRQENGWGPGGQASELLQRMLHAARLHQGSQVWLAPMQRSTQGGVQGLEQALALEPDLVFIMGRLAAQALLETAEPLGRLRGQVHELWGTPAIVSYDCVTLLRNPADKAKAWDDLCLALQLAREQHAQRLEAG